MKIVTGKVLDAKGGESGYVKVKLDHNGQEIKAHYSNGMVQKGSRVTLISDEMDNFYMLGTSYSGMDEVVNILLDLMQKLIEQNEYLASMKTIDTHPNAPGNWSHDKVGNINGVKSDITTLKNRLSKFKF